MLSGLADLALEGSPLRSPRSCVILDPFEIYTFLLRQGLALAHPICKLRNFVFFENALKLELTLTNTAVLQLKTFSYEQAVLSSLSILVFSRGNSSDYYGFWRLLFY